MKIEKKIEKPAEKPVEKKIEKKIEKQDLVKEINKALQTLENELKTYQTTKTNDNLVKVWNAAQKELAMFVKGDKFYDKDFAKKFNLFTAGAEDFKTFATFVKNLIDAKKASNAVKPEDRDDRVVDLEVELQKTLRGAIETWFKAIEQDASKKPNTKEQAVKKEQIKLVGQLLQQLINNDPNGAKTTTNDGSLELCYDYSYGDKYIEHPVKTFVEVLAAFKLAQEKLGLKTTECIQIPDEALKVIAEKTTDASWFTGLFFNPQDDKTKLI